MRSRTPGQVAHLAVRIGDGETIPLAVRLVFDAGALVAVHVPPAPAGADPREIAARRLVQQLGAQLARPGAPGITQLRREAELVADVAEQLADLEASRAPVAGAA